MKLKQVYTESIYHEIKGWRFITDAGDRAYTRTLGVSIKIIGYYSEVLNVGVINLCVWSFPEIDETSVNFRVNKTDFYSSEAELIRATIKLFDNTLIELKSIQPRSESEAWAEYESDSED